MDFLLLLTQLLKFPFKLLNFKIEELLQTVGLDLLEHPGFKIVDQVHKWILLVLNNPTEKRITVKKFLPDYIEYTTQLINHQHLLFAPESFRILNWLHSQVVQLLIQGIKNKFVVNLQNPDLDLIHLGIAIILELSLQAKESVVIEYFYFFVARIRN